MINVRRPPNEPADLAHQRVLAAGTCNTPAIRLAVANTFFNKCYLCETDKAPHEIEHLEAHGEVAAIKFRWNNLFYACPTCNGIKSITNNDILDCCDFTTIITDTIRFDTNNNNIENFVVDISSNNVTAPVVKTVTLLNRCYTGTTFESINVAFEKKKYLIEELNKLKVLIKEYFHNMRQGINARAAEKMTAIRAELQLSKPFLAFKITFIREEATLLATFGHLLPQFTP